MDKVADSSEIGSADATARLLSAYHLRGDARARERLIELHLPLVEALARRHARGGEGYEDLVQVGSIGLINAIDRFDLQRGFDLPAFAVPHINGEIKRHLRDRGESVRLPRGISELRGRLGAARHELTGSLGREPTAAELATELGVGEDAVARALNAGRAVPSSDDEIGSRLADSLGLAEDRMALAEAFDRLDERERRIVYLRYVRDLDPEAVASELGISKRHLSRQTQAALAKLRRGLESEPSGQPEQSLRGPAERPNMAPMESSAVSTPYLDRPYHIVLVRDEGDDSPGWTARVEELPGCEAHADTADEATRAIRDSMEAWISEALANNREVPEPRGAPSYSGRLMLRMPHSLHAELARAAERDEVSLNQFITSSLASSVGWRQQNGEAPSVDAEPADEPAESGRSDRGWLSRAMIVNAVLLGLAGIAAVVLLVVALSQGS
jgi:RNA polymerase sigma-B factor